MTIWTQRSADFLLESGVPWRAVALYQAIPCSTTYELAWRERRPDSSPRG